LLTEGRTSPEALGQAGQYITQNSLDQPVTSGVANVTQEQNRLVGAQAGQQYGVPQAEQQARAGELGYENTLNPYKIGAAPLIGQSMYNQAATDAATSGQARTDIPINTGTQLLGDIRQNYQAGLMPDEMVSAPYVSHVTPQGVQGSGGLINPQFRPAAAAMIQAIQNGSYFGGGSGGQTGTLSSGRGFNYNPPPPISSPTLGTAYQPLPSNEDIPPEGVHSPDIQAKHDADVEALKAQQANLKAKQKQLIADHYERGARGARVLVHTPQLVGYHREHTGHGQIVNVPDYK